jgi:pyruvate formate lyase activating enzyme
MRDGGSIYGEEVLPERIVILAKDTGCESIAYTYTEPTIFFEYAYDTARLAQEAGLKNVFVTNGYMTAEALKTISPYLDAANVDLKSFDNSFYKKWVKARLQPVLDSIKLMKELNIWVEITTLIIPTLNDSDENLHQIAGFIAEEAGVSTPWHISRFHPDYDLKHLPQTPIESIHKAREIGLKAGLRYVYEGNVPKNGNENTYCHNCGSLLINRSGYLVAENKSENGNCYKCGTELAGVGI